MIEVKNLTKRYGNHLAVDHLNFTVESGKIYGFLGPNGAGKTTLMQMICGIIEPTAGEVKINGENNIQMGERFRDMLGYLPQEFGYTPGFTANDFMLYIASIKGLPPRFAKRKTKELLKLVNLEKDAGRKIRTFSGGMKRRLGIAQALLNDPKILILDEPTAGQDLIGINRLENILTELKKENKTVVTITHDMEFAVNNFKKIFVMSHKNLLRVGNAKEIFSDDELLKDSMLKKTYIGDLCDRLNLNETAVTIEEFLKYFV